MSEHINALLDPRGYQERPMLELAKRPTLELSLIHISEPTRH